MKRSEIIKKLVSEGISEKTLSIMSDKQINTLSKRILGEETVFISKTNPNFNQEITKAKTAKKTIETYESDMKETTEPKESARTLANQNRPNQHQSKKFKAGSPFKNNFSPVETPKTTKKFKKEERPKVKGVSKPFAKKSEVKEDKKTKLVKALKNIKESDEVKIWVEGLVKENYHNITTKNEIMDVVKKKITEQMAEPGVAEPTTRPTTKPGNPNREKKRESFPNPWDPPKENPNIDPDPKFETDGLPEWLTSDDILSMLNESKLDRLTSVIIKKLQEQVFNEAVEERNQEYRIDSEDKRNNNMEKSGYGQG